ncbi:exonuclease 3'-5' domain-containing protein 2-like [Aedes albopictus]|uniref:3'-5' exonuclease domain-containing protein n=1 Tax=Aedes albopictus TaxID=7160 RepID=A0ABM1ZE89_AEDAL|nr:exonuclease 3'-5' domain-containing protein 2-like [Aedes albopictus]
MADNVCASPSIKSIDFSSYKVHVVGNYNSCQKLLHELKQHCEDYPVLGFDCEWWSTCMTDPKGHRRKVALLQLASAAGLCLLIQLTLLSDIPQELRDLLDDSRILKVGVEPLGDGSKLHHDYGLAVQGTVDLQTLAHHLDISPPYGLKALAKSVLGFEMVKKRQVALSNWEKPQLKARQIDYASKDAIVGLEIFRALNERIELREMDPFLDVCFKPPAVPTLEKQSSEPPQKKPRKRHPRSNLTPQMRPLPIKRLRVDPRQHQQLQGHLYTEF